MRLAEKEYNFLKCDTIYYLMQHGFSPDEIDNRAIDENLSEAFRSLTYSKKLEYVILSEDVSAYLRGKDLDISIKNFLAMYGIKNKSIIIMKRIALKINEMNLKRSVRKMIKKNPPNIENFEYLEDFEDIE